MKSGEKRIAMWSGAHTVSTLLLRAFENRPDTQVVDEPFYAHYLKQTGHEYPGYETVLGTRSTDVATIEASLLEPLEPGKRIFYQKHMSHHIFAGMDQRWFEAMTNAFLICDPLAVLAYFKKSTQDKITLSDLGVQQQLALFDYIADKTGTAPPVVDSNDIMKNPKKTLTKLCSALDIAFDDTMLAWPAGPRESDGPWAPWQYQDIEMSSGFESVTIPKLDPSDDLHHLADLAMPFYERLARYRL